MKKDIAELWVKALRSGKYKQARGHLKTTEGHCCLGVLCAISPLKNNYTKLPNEHGVKNSVLPEAVVDWANMKSQNGMLPDGMYLSERNDNGTSFEEIATLIECYYKQL